MITLYYLADTTQIKDIIYYNITYEYHNYYSCIHKEYFKFIYKYVVSDIRKQENVM